MAYKLKNIFGKVTYENNYTHFILTEPEGLRNDSGEYFCK